MLRYVLLEHDTGAGDGAGARTGIEHGTHWDLMIERPDGDALWTWRLDLDPRASGSVRSERIADHRSAYLAYEGPISDGRGCVRRVAAGKLRLTESSETRMRFVSDGGMAGAWEITAPVAAGRLTRTPNSDDACR
ncbi:MAG: hypothetical protein HRU75_10485 [Planctomycetia bacterium]|nr:MAG: hypothetical protein HRU75_10485 [Planctomycetia bacterium]